jgi:hypothetical protein
VLTAVVLIVAVLVVIGAVVKIFDLKRKREAEAVHLQAQISDALLRDPQLFGLPVTPTAHVPWKGTPATIEVTGHVPSDDARDTVLRLVRQEAARLRSDFTVQDRLEVTSTLVRAA